MINTKKIIGVFIGLAGVFISRYNLWNETDSPRVLFMRIAGVAIACAGIAVFASGIQKKVEAKICICPNCYTKNDASNESCSRCAKPLLKTQPF